MPLRFHPYSYKKGLYPDVSVMRYMRIEHFKELVSNSQLYLRRCDKFPDEAEGSLPLKEYLFNQKQNYGPTLSKGHQQVKEHFFASCWHLNNKDSTLMWDSFLSKEEGVAIVTDIEGLLLSCQAEKSDVYLTRIKYLDYNNDVFYADDYPIRSENMFTPLTCKSIYYEQEQEVRILASQYTQTLWEKDEEGICISVDLENLIKGVIIKPKMDANLKHQLYIFCKKNIPHTTILESSIQQKIHF